MLRKPGYKKFWNVAPVYGKAAAGGSFALSYQGKKIATTGNSAYNGFTVAGGSTRTIAVILWPSSTGPGTISSMTIGGVACTQVPGAYASGGGDQTTDIWISNSAVTGGTVNVSITYSGATTADSAVGLYNLTTTSPTPASGVNNPDSFGVSSSSVGPISIPSGGGAVWGSYIYLGATASVNSGNAVIDDSYTPGGLSYYFGHTTATGSQTLGLTLSGSDRPYTSLAAWGP